VGILINNKNKEVEMATINVKEWAEEQIELMNVVVNNINTEKNEKIFGFGCIWALQNLLKEIDKGGE
jgi:hypothetical protein